MVSISPNGVLPLIWAEDMVCKLWEQERCIISSSQNSRQYLVHVTAIDEAGNIGMATCRTIVGNQNVDPNEPIFLHEKLEIVGGIDLMPQLPDKMYYPAWPSNHCFNDGKEPEYMRNNPTAYMLPSKESCCARYFSYRYAACIANSNNGNIGGGLTGGTSPILNEVQWYADWATLK